MKNTIRPDAFIYSAVKAVDLSGQEEALEEKIRRPDVGNEKITIFVVYHNW